MQISYFPNCPTQLELLLHKAYFLFFNLILNRVSTCLISRESGLDAQYVDKYGRI